jgi:hypothetical protein
MPINTVTRVPRRVSTFFRICIGRRFYRLGQVNIDLDFRLVFLLRVRVRFLSAFKLRLRFMLRIRFSLRAGSCDAWYAVVFYEVYNRFLFHCPDPFYEIVDAFILFIGIIERFYKVNEGLFVGIQNGHTCGFYLFK